MFERKDLFRDIKYSKYKDALNKQAKIIAKKKTEELIKKRLEKRQRRRDVKNDVFSESQNLTAIETSDTVGNSGDPILADTSGMKYLSLDSFFQRPVLLDEFDLTIGTNNPLRLNPWLLWASDGTVLSKLSNYAFFRGDMNIQVVVSSTKFHYGNLLISYQPKHRQNEILKLYLAALADAKLIHVPFNNYLSQSAETAIIRIGRDNNVTMKLPFIHHHPHIRLFNEDGALINNTFPFDDMDHMGEVYLSMIGPLRCANDDFQSSAHVQVYAWVTDISLGSITATDIEAISESKDVVRTPKRYSTKSNSKSPSINNKKKANFNSPNFESFKKTVVNNGLVKDIASYASAYSNDEYADAGPVTKIASAVSNIANNLTNVPFIGGLAKASSIAVGYGAKLANYFGFSKPANIQPLELTKIQDYSNMANYSGKESNIKLSGDPKCELSISPLGGEAECDPMAISFITSRESYFHTFNWTLTDGIGDDTLAVFPVSPQLRSRFNGTNSLYQPTAMCFAADLFKFWRGTITFRFEVACSSFHRGKLMIIYEPNSFNAGLIEAKTTNFNQQFITYFDIETDDSVTLDVEYCAERSFTPLAEDQFALTGIHSLHDAYENFAGTNTTFPKGFCAGYLTVRVFNALKSPAVTSGSVVSVNVYAYSEDLELAMPTTCCFANKVFSESADSIAGTQRVGVPSASYSLNQGVTNSDDIYLYNFGERITSFRSYLKKFHSVYDGSFDLGAARLTIRSDIYGGVPTAQIPAYNTIKAADNSENNITLVHNAFNYLRFGYLFMKGGMRYKMSYKQNDFRAAYVSVFPLQFTGTKNYGQFTMSDVYNPLYNTYTQVFVNKNIEFECPFFSNSLFSYSHMANSSQEEPSGHHGTVFEVGILYDTDASRQSSLHQAIADDFTFFRFQGGAPKAL